MKFGICGIGSLVGILLIICILCLLRENSVESKVVIVIVVIGLVLVRILVVNGLRLRFKSKDFRFLCV